MMRGVDIMDFERACLIIDLDNIRHNVAELASSLAPGTKLIGTVKADGYGHGALMTARAIGPYVWGYAVATAGEAAELREGGIEKPVLILGVIPESEYSRMVNLDARLTVFKADEAKRLSAAALALDKKAKIHIAVDTGMGRIGLFPTDKAAREVEYMAGLPGLEIEGMFTHFARADEADLTPAREQLARFLGFADMVREAGVEIPILHCANSAAAIMFPEARLDMARAGIAMYGIYPSDGICRGRVDLRPAMELKAAITFIKEVPAETPVSYGGTFVTKRKTRVATVGLGYGDGYPRGCSNRGYALVRGQRAPVLGRVCMDQLMLDVTDVGEAAEGDIATFLGSDGGARITMEELEAMSGGFRYEIPCLFTRRLPRIYKGAQQLTKDGC